MKKRILVIDDDLDLCFLLQKLFESEGFECETAITGQKGLALFREKPFPLVLCDFRLPDIEGLEILGQIKEIDSSAQVIIVTGYSDVRLAVKTIKMGAFDYVTKPILPDEIIAMANRALKKRDENQVDQSPPTSRSNSKKPPKTQKKTGDQPFIGQSPAFQKVLKHIQLVAPTTMSVIIEGETGAGKEIVARMLHQSSKRAEQPFVAVDCGAIPESLVASELFGHVKGAFTGATSDKKGHFMRANKGTLFLDEIGNLSYDIQVRLLRVLQERTVQRVGENKSHKLDIRLLVATNEPLVQKIEDGSFRLDLYHRLNEFKIAIPSLKERKEDIPGLADYFLRQFNSELETQVTGFTPEAMQLLLNYSWIGNIREMRNVIQRSVLMAQDGKIQKHHLPDEIILQNPFSSPLPKENPATSVAPQPQTEPASTFSLKNASQHAEAEMIMDALRQCNFNRSKTAKLLNIDRKTLYNKIKKLGIKI